MRSRQLAGELKKLDRLLWQKAWHCHKRLPRRARVWIDVEDLHCEAQICTLRALRKWTRDRGSKTTFVFVCVDNCLRSLAERLQTRKRMDHGDLQLSDFTQEEIDRRAQFTYEPMTDPVVRMVCEWHLNRLGAAP